MHRTIALLALLTALVPAPMVAQQGCAMKGDTTSSMGGMGGMGGMGMDHAMMARMDSLDARLDSLAKVMNRATGTRKVNVMGEVISALVAERLDMRRMMHEHMMQQMGMPGMSGDSMMKMGMDGSGCTPVARPDSARSRDPMHQH